MKNLIVSSLVVASAAVVFGGCAVRDQKMWQDDVQNAVQPRQPDMTACYNNVLKTTPTAAGKVFVNIEVETDKGTFSKVEVDKAKSTAPAEVQDCVTKSLTGLSVSPPDKKIGQGTLEFEFAAGAPAPAAPGAAPATPPKT